jgi:hypothetical protein
VTHDGGTGITVTVDAGEIVADPGARVSLSGDGCGKGAAVHVVLEASTHATMALEDVNADQQGRFTVTVNIPNLGATADLSAACVGPTDADWYQIDLGIRYAPA